MITLNQDIPTTLKYEDDSYAFRMNMKGPPERCISEINNIKCGKFTT